jgi:hypothetical protein
MTGQTPILSFPEQLRDDIERTLVERGYSYTRPEALASAVMRLSTFYAKNPTLSTPWRETWCQIAYLAYYLPLNWWRARHAIDRGREVGFFEDLDSLIDFGSGLGSVSFALSSAGLEFQKSTTWVEHASESVQLHKKLNRPEYHSRGEWFKNISDAPKPTGSTLAVFSYSLTELKDLPEWTTQCGAILVIEPATQSDSRRLLTLRQKLIDLGWTIAAPCTHQKPCPMLTMSQTDWCHDRVAWEQPSWLKDIERFMPIKNGTLPYSYLMARKNHCRTTEPNVARLTGDLQEFKGFAKQMVCRNEDREFIAWQRKNFKKEYPAFERGLLVKISDLAEKTANEIRAKNDDIAKL